MELERASLGESDSSGSEGEGSSRPVPVAPKPIFIISDCTGGLSKPWKGGARKFDSARQSLSDGDCETERHLPSLHVVHRSPVKGRLGKATLNACRIQETHSREQFQIALPTPQKATNQLTLKKICVWHPKDAFL